MPQTCGVMNCANTKGMGDDKPNISFHKFPKDVELRQVWVRACGDFKKPEKLAKGYICSAHFALDCYGNNFALEFKLTGNSKLPRLLPGAIPTINLPKTSTKSVQTPIIDNDFEEVDTDGASDIEDDCIPYEITLKAEIASLNQKLADLTLERDRWKKMYEDLKERDRKCVKLSGKFVPSDCRGKNRLLLSAKISENHLPDLRVTNDSNRRKKIKVQSINYDSESDFSRIGDVKVVKEVDVKFETTGGTLQYETIHIKSNFDKISKPDHL